MSVAPAPGGIRPWLTRTPAGVRLCAMAELAPLSARNFVLEIQGDRFHGFVVRRGEAVTGYVDRCPHAGVPLAFTLDDYLAQDLTGRDVIRCSWHSALFDIDTGRCVAGPCPGQGLLPWPVTVRDGFIETL
ncbi:Rieske (2Fe-2S) protein [Nitrospirillum viridazoti]|nr:Rieske (2Fe-2S) protein [Nitrospirillum amazonense]TWB42967.1 nitrite reductase/ring-hydroxylating ferredoxin subunit [Nitrospirillum amazonense]